MKRKLTVNEQVKQFVLYQIVNYGNKPRFRRISGDLVLPAKTKEVKKHFQKPNLYGVEMLGKGVYVQNDKGVFVPEEQKGNGPKKFNLDKIVLSHSFKARDTRPEPEKNKSYVVSIRTEFVDGDITGDIYDVPLFKNVTGEMSEMGILEQHLKKNRVIALYAFQNPNLEKLFMNEPGWKRGEQRYRKPHCIIINTTAITEYGFQKR